MKKFISGLLAVIMIVSLLTVSAAESPKFVRVTASAAGDQVTLSLQALEKTTNGRFVIHYDPDVLAFLETEMPATVCCWETAEGAVELAYIQTQALAPAEVLAELHFSVEAHQPATEISVILEDFNHREGMHLPLDPVTVNTALPFTDVAPEDWFYDAVAEAYQAGWISGASETLFEPYGTMTRGMFVTVLGRMAGVSADAPETTSFADVAPDAYYAPYVQWAAEEGIVEGMTDTRFCPGTLVTRQQIVTFLYRYAAVLGMDTAADHSALDRFADGDTVAAYAQDAMSWAIEQQLIEGTASGLSPRAAADRAQGTALLVRFAHMTQKG